MTDARIYLDTLVARAKESKLDVDIVDALQTSITYARNIPIKDFEEVLEISSIVDELRELRTCQN